MAYRSKPAIRTWRGRRLPGGCFSVLTVLGMVAVMGAAVVGLPRLLPQLGVGAHLAGGFAAVIAAFTYIWALARAEGWLARLLPQSGEVAIDRDELSLRVAGMRDQRLRFVIDEELTVRCASYDDGFEGHRTFVILRRGDDVAVWSSEGQVECFLRKVRVEEHPIDLPQDCLTLDLEHAALEEVLSLVDEELAG